jgi:NAD(P)-dependent dehydrogenase (short-subunit alcohol dehydrogenase family)
MPVSRVAVVTGGASGIGRSIVEQLARQGHRVTIVDRNRAGADEVARSLQEAGCSVGMIAADVGDSAAVRDTMNQVRREMGPIAILVHSAGICALAPLPELSDELFDQTLAVHVRGAFLCSRAVAPDMLAAGWGRIVHITSVAGMNGGGPGLAHYAAAKGGLIGLTKALAQELAPGGITVNAVAPGMIDTPMLRASGMPDSMVELLAKRTPVGRIGHPNDIAAACLYLVSEAAGFITGQVISPNGGAYM